LGVEQQPRKLLSNVRGIDFVEMEGYKVCCGFGGTFAVKFPEVSAAMGQDKLGFAAATKAEFLVANDSGCLMHLAGMIHRQGLALKTMHLAEVLAQQ
jgi:L-lactate dehydrogenase complex protein LldE